jgi:uncharacterized protein (TIGR03083 family)
MIREAYASAARWFAATVAQIAPGQWEHAALGEWNVRDLTGHTARALLTVETYLDTPADRVELGRPAEYFVRALDSLADPAAVAARGRDAGKALGDDPAAAVRAAVERVLARLQHEADDAIVATPVGGMRLIDYLPSRVFELTIHTLDLAAALDRDVAIPEASAAVTLQLLADLAQQRGKTAELLRAATGRTALQAGFSVLA